jgi:hypothetical protein
MVMVFSLLLAKRSQRPKLAICRSRRLAAVVVTPVLYVCLSAVPSTG